MKPSGQGLLLYLLTGPESSSVPGLVFVGPAALAEALGWAAKDCRSAAAELEAQGLARFDPDARLVWLPGELTEPENPNVARHWAHVLSEAPDSELLESVIGEVLSAVLAKSEAVREKNARKGENADPEAYLRPFRERFPKRFPNGSGNRLETTNPSPIPSPSPNPPKPPKGAELVVLAPVDVGTGELASAWIAGVREHTRGPVARLSPPEVREVLEIARAFGAPRRGQELDDWMRATATEFCRANDPAFGGYTPRRCRNWLSAGKASPGVPGTAPRPWPAHAKQPRGNVPWKADTSGFDEIAGEG